MRPAALAVLALLPLLLAAPLAHAQLDVQVQPKAPPELQEVVQRLLGLIMWIAWAAVIGVGVIVAVKFMAGDREAVQGLRNWLLGLILLATLLSIINWLTAGGG